MKSEVKTSFPKNTTFIKIKAPRLFPRFLRCLFLMLLKSAILASEIRKQGIDALYILSGFWEQNICLVASKIAKKPLVIRLRGDDWAVRRLSKHRATPFLPLIRLYDNIETFVLNHASHIITINDFLKEAAIAHGVKEEKITTVYHGVSSDLFKPLHKKKMKKRFTVCCPSRLARGKGIEDLLKAVKDLDVEVIILGGGEKGYVEKLVEKAPSNVNFLGYVKHKEMPKYINCADVVVSPQFFEGWGRVVLEAMSCGKPVIATSSPRAYAAIGFKGWAIKTGNIEELRKAIIEASETPKHVLEEMGKVNREIILRKFNWNVTYKKILKIIESYC